MRGFVYSTLLIVFALLLLAGSGVLYSLKEYNVPVEEWVQKTIEQVINHPSSTIPVLPELPPETTPESTSTPSSLDLSKILSVPEVLANKEILAGKEIKVRGMVFVKYFAGMVECSVNPITDCMKEAVPKVSLRDPNNTTTPWTSEIDIYAKTIEGNYTPFPCKFVTGGVDCGQFKDREIATFKGLFVKDKVPLQVIGSSSGQSEVIKWQDIYFLVVD